MFFLTCSQTNSQIQTTTQSGPIDVSCCCCFCCCICISTVRRAWQEHIHG